MKVIDKQGKLFGKLHIFDCVLLILIVVVIIGATSKFSGTNLLDMSGSENKKLEIVFETTGYREEYFANIKVGDQLAEDKHYLDGRVTAIEIVDFKDSDTDKEGNLVTGSHPYRKSARITVEATVDYNDPVYKLGKEEIIKGKVLFFTTDKVKLSATIMDYKEIN